MHLDFIHPGLLLAEWVFKFITNCFCILIFREEFVNKRLYRIINPLFIPEAKSRLTIIVRSELNFIRIIHFCIYF